MSEAWNGMRGFLLLMRTMREFGFERRGSRKGERAFYSFKRRDGGFLYKGICEKNKDLTVYTPPFSALHSGQQLAQ